MNDIQFAMQTVVTNANTESHIGIQNDVSTETEKKAKNDEQSTAFLRKFRKAFELLAMFGGDKSTKMNVKSLP